MQCFYCGKEFNLSGKQGGQNRQFCFDCMPEGLERKERDNLRRKLVLKKVSDQKIQMGCSKCGYNRCAQALEWHHDNDDKNFTPADKVRDGNVKSFTAYQEEIKKCILLCANCHREAHYINGDEV